MFFNQMGETADANSRSFREPRTATSAHATTFRASMSNFRRYSVFLLPFFLHLSLSLPFPLHPCECNCVCVCVRFPKCEDETAQNRANQGKHGECSSISLLPRTTGPAEGEVIYQQLRPYSLGGGTHPGLKGAPVIRLPFPRGSCNQEAPEATDTRGKNHKRGDVGKRRAGGRRS